MIAFDTAIALAIISGLAILYKFIKEAHDNSKKNDLAIQGLRDRELLNNQSLQSQINLTNITVSAELKEFKTDITHQIIYLKEQVKDTQAFLKTNSNFQERSRPSISD